MSNNKKYVVEANFIEEASKLNLSLSDFLLLIYFENSDDLTFDLDKISSKLKVDKNVILEGYNNLLSKKLINPTNEKDSNGKIVEKVSLDNFYELLKEKNKKEKNEKLKEDIFSTFESKFKRPLSSSEIEVIKAWLEKMYSEEIILAALDEAVYNKVTSIRYIDTILYEWSKVGIKTKEDIINREKNRFEGKKIEETSVFEYNWLDDDK